MRGLIAMSPRHLLVLLATLSALLVPAAVAWACGPSSNVRTDKFSYRPGEQMTVSGRGFWREGTSLTITPEPAGAYAEGVPVDSEGRFLTQLRAPDQPGSYVLLVTSSDGGPPARTTFEVDASPPPAPQVPSPSPAPRRCAIDKLGIGGADSLTGTEAGDRIFAFAGDDVVNALAADDCLYGGSGGDRLYGDLGHDTVGAQGGNDLAFGQGGNDLVYGADGNGRLGGGSGLDTLAGGRGADILGVISTTSSTEVPERTESARGEAARASTREATTTTSAPVTAGSTRSTAARAATLRASTQSIGSPAVSG